jgi:hypothetical protein
MSPTGTAETGVNFQPVFGRPLRGLIGFGNADPQLKLRAIVGRLGEADKADAHAPGRRCDRGDLISTKFLAGARRFRLDLWEGRKYGSGTQQCRL